MWRRIGMMGEEGRRRLKPLQEVLKEKRVL